MTLGIETLLREGRKDGTIGKFSIVTLFACDTDPEGKVI
jgi:hypothetical protein